MRMLGYAMSGTPGRSGPTPKVGKLLAGLALFLGVSALTYFLIWLGVVYFVSHLFNIPL